MKNRFAFSLVEAMIILIMVSVAVMLLIPLITKKTDYPRWVPLKNNAGNVVALGYGINNFQRVGVGSINPYTAIPMLPNKYPRLTLDRLAFFNAEELNSEGIFLGIYSKDATDLSKSNLKYKEGNVDYPMNSIVMGVNPVNTVKNSIALHSFQNLGTDYSIENTVSIGHGIDESIAGVQRILKQGAIYYKDGEGLTLRGFALGNGLTSKNIIEVTPTATKINFAYQDSTTLTAENLKSVNLFDIKSNTIDINADVKFGASGAGILTIGNSYPKDVITCNCTIQYCNGSKSVGSDGKEKWSGSWTAEAAYNPSDNFEGGAAEFYNYNDISSVPTKKDTKKSGSCSEAQDGESQVSCVCDCRNRTPSPNICPCVNGYDFSSKKAIVSLPFVSANPPSLSSPTYCKATMERQATYGNAFWTTSDKRLKNIISKFDKGFDELSKIDKYLFTFKNDKKQRIRPGIIAQKLIGVFDEALLKDSDGYYNYDKSSLLYAMVNSVKEFFNKQLDIVKKQKKLNKKADKLLRMYE